MDKSLFCCCKLCLLEASSRTNCTGRSLFDKEPMLKIYVTVEHYSNNLSRTSVYVLGASSWTNRLRIRSTSQRMTHTYGLRPGPGRVASNNSCSFLSSWTRCPHIPSLSLSRLSMNNPLACSLLSSWTICLRVPSMSLTNNSC